MEEQTLEGLIRFYSFAAVLYGLIVMVFGVSMAAGWMGTDITDAFLGMLFLIMALLMFITARGLWLRAIWARYAAVAVSAILVIYSLFTFSPEKTLVLIIAGSAAIILYRQY